MAIDAKEKAMFGFLGRIPPEVINADARVAELWKKLASDAEKVAHMRNVERRTEEAKLIETRYHNIINIAKAQKAQRNESR